MFVAENKCALGKLPWPTHSAKHNHFSYGERGVIPVELQIIKMTD